MPINALLIRWTEGWREVTNPASIAIWGRREALLGLGAVSSAQEVDRVGGQQLAIFGDVRQEISADHRPMSVADRPYRSYGIGDTITVPDYGAGTSTQRVRSITGSEDENGEVTYAPTLGDIILEEQERVLLSIKKMADGTLDGESPVATPVSGIYETPKLYGTAPFPGGLILTTTVASNADGSQVWYGFDPGVLTDYQLVSFTATTPNYGQIDGQYPVVQLWQEHGGDAWQVAEVDIGYGYSPGTYTGTISDSALQAGDGYGIGFRGPGGFIAGLTATATFSNGNGTVTLPWVMTG